MRIAILVSGQPRFLDQGTWWMRERVFPVRGKIKFDYFCHFWDDGSPDLLNRAKFLYTTDNVIVEDFDEVITHHSNLIRHRNTSEFTDWNYVPKHAQETMLFDTPEINDYGKNWHGQYLSTGRLTEAFADKLHDYDIVIKTRSDCIFNNMSEQEWLSAFSNIYKNSMFRNTLFANWLYVKAGLPYHGDFAFIGAPDTWLQYGTNIVPGLIKLCTEDKHWFEETHEMFDTQSSHWAWNKLNIYSRNDWLSFGVTWPTRFDATLIRDENYVYIKNYNMIRARYDEVG